LPQLVDRDAPLDREGAFAQSLLAHLARQQQCRRPEAGGSQCDAEAERRLAAANVATEDNEILPAETAAERAVE
jgi:hypothetical protein